MGYLISFLGIVMMAAAVGMGMRPPRLLALLNRNSYEKGGFVLHMLRAQVGERAFFDAIRAYYMKYRHATALSDDLRAEMERTSHQNLGWFFDQWLRRPGYPEVDATWSYDTTSRQVNVELTQGARFGAFRFPLVVGIVDSAGVVHRTTVEMTTAEGATVRMQTASTSRPMRVVLDPDVAMLARFAVTAR
jgi:aminopeptidase N